MKIRRLVLTIVLAFALAGYPASVGAQDKSPHNYTVVVGHVVHLVWTASTTANVTYKIYVSGVSGGPYTNLGSTPLLLFSDLAATSGNTYYYVVTAVNNLGQESVFSNEIVAAIPNP